MLDSIHVENYKSVKNLDLHLGRINVFIGENGAGKSNILEAIALAGAAQAGKLDNEFLVSRGIRVTSPKFMRSAFEPDTDGSPISVRVVEDGVDANFNLFNDNQPYSNWTERTNDLKIKDINVFLEAVKEFTQNNSSKNASKRSINALRAKLELAIEKFDSDFQPSEAISFSFADAKSKRVSIKLRPPVKSLSDFIVYSPENSALRQLTKEGQIEPLGIYGEGLLKLLTVMQHAEDKSDIETVKDALRMFSWFEDFEIPENNVEGVMKISDRFLYTHCEPFDQFSPNEGFLFAAFYFALFTSKLTPSFFAVDNIDASLNPALCEEMMKRLGVLAKTHNKQAILTTHNASILDGLDLRDPEQKLFAVSRNLDGYTQVDEVKLKHKTEKPTRLSALFTGGLIGGLAHF